MNDPASIFRVLSSRRTCLSLTALLALGGVAKAETLRDPTRPATAQAAPQDASASLQLEAIMYSGTRRIAIVDGRIVRAGERIGSALIEEIGSDSIRYTRNGRTEISSLAKQPLSVRQATTSPENKL